MVKMHNQYGECDYASCTLLIASHVDGVATSQDQRYGTFWHEFIHAALHTLGLEDSEQLAAGMEQMLYQLHRTARWKDLPK
jgi:hypothetical protein